MNSWIGGSLSSLKGQLSHLITEGTEEISDSSTEIVTAKKKISELENELNSADNEIVNLKEINNELLMRLQSEELLLQSVSESYKEKLKEKEEIVEMLTNKLSHTRSDTRNSENREMNNRLSISDDNYSNEYLDHSNLSNLDEITRLKSKVNLLNQEIAKWKASSDKEAGSDQIYSFDDTVKILLEEQQREMEMQHSNYIMELQQEHGKQIHFLNQKLQQLEQSITDDEYTRGFPQDDSSAMDKINIQKSVQDLSTQTDLCNPNDPIADPQSRWIPYLEVVSENEITSILDMITDKIIQKEATIESIVQKINGCNNHQCSKHSSDLVSNCYQTHSEMPTVDGRCRYSSGGMSDNQLKISTQMKQVIADSMSQVSDISEVSIKSRMLEEHVKNLSNQLTDYEQQFIDIEELSKGFDNLNNVVINVDDISEIGSKIQNLKAKLSERKCVISKHVLLECTDEERSSNVEDSWENSSNNSLVEEQNTGLHQEVGIDIRVQDQIIELYRLLLPDLYDNASNVDMLRKIIRTVIGMVKMDESRIKLEHELMNMYNDIHCGNVLNQSHDTFEIIDALKDNFRSMRETCSVHDYILEENKSLQELLSKCQQKIENLDLEKSELIAKNTELDGQLIDMSITIARYEGLETICDKYQKEMSAKSKPPTHKTNLSMDSDDILEHVETFNQEKDECIQALESKIISLQNLCEEKDDYINDLKQREVNIIYEYDALIEVLKGELDSVRAIVEKSNESELTYKKQQQELHDLVNEKETMIKSLNEELTMLSIIDIENEVVPPPPPPPSNKKYKDDSSQTPPEHDDDDDDDGDSQLKNNLEKRIEYLMVENQRLEKVVEAQASSLNQYEVRVTNLQVELSKLSRLSNIDQEVLSAEDMTKETLHHLSEMIRDKEWEIEALKSKNASLYEIIKQYNHHHNNNEDTTTSLNVDYIETVLNEKESLSKELSWYQENRDQLISALNLKHKESLNYHGEIQRLISYINTEQEKWNDALSDNEQLKEQIKQLVIMEKSLVNSDLERIEKPIKQMVDTAVSFNSHPLLVQQQDDGDDDEDILLPQECSQCRQFKEKCSDLDEENRKYCSEIRCLEKRIEQSTFELEQVHLQITELTTNYDRVQQQLVFCQNELANQYKNNVVPNRTDDSTKNIWNTDYQEEVSQAGAVLDDKEQLRQQLHQRQIDCDNFTNQIEQLKGKELKLLKEKQIFQDHLIRIEESYTQDATLAEDREQILRKQLHTTEDNLQSANEEIHKLQSIVSNIRNELRIELNDAKNERDEAQRQLKEAQIQLADHMKSLSNLQSVLDRFQQEQSIEMLYQKERYQQDIDKLTKDRDDWEHRCNILQMNMDQQKDLVDAAQRLSDQIELKDDQLAELQALLAKKEEMIDSLKMEIRRLNTFTESKVDKILMRNLVIGYFHTPPHRRQEALKVIGSLLQFADADYNQIGIDTANKSRWFSWLRPASNDKSLGGQDSELTGKSFSELFITFLEKESTPMPQVKLPTNQIAAAARQHSSLSLSQEYPYAAHSTTSALSSVIDHHKFFPSSPVITKRNGSPSNDESQLKEDPANKNTSLLYIPNIKELNPDLNQKDHKTISNHRRSESSRNALLSLLDQ